MAGPTPQQPNVPPMPAMPKGVMLGMMVAMAVMLIVVSFRDAIGGALNFIFYPLIGFGGQLPVLSLILAGVIMITLSTVLRTLLTDPIKMARNQQVQSEFNRELREARIENNLYKIKKLTESQPAMMAKSMETSTDQMKIMPVTMIVIMPIYTWVYYFLQLSGTVTQTMISIPWGTVDLLGVTVLPHWILVYTLISIPIGQLVNKIIKAYLFRKRLKELEEEMQVEGA
jgi:uncharacterized membrane protein (DUF106 family)